MSELSFKVYCIENYAEYKNLSSSAVFEKFLNSRLLKHLETDYEDLHGMGKEYLMDYASPVTRIVGNDLIQKELPKIPSDKVRQFVEKNLDKIEHGERDFRI